ncbi:MAG: DUF455 family protein, partial [Sphingomonadaceae bacterium]|nr:DUF455 family protein [Sphingomonadaceae bacterium]
PMVLEARGLDVTPPTIERFEAAGDMISARNLSRIMADEIRHVAFGVKWFEFSGELRNRDPRKYWQELVSRHFRGRLKPPFNASARRQAGLPRDYYSPLASGEPS